MEKQTFENSTKKLFKHLKEESNQNLEDEVMIQIVNFKKYPKEILDEIMDEMILLNSEKFDNGTLFPIEIKDKKTLKNHIKNGYNPNEFFECWSNKRIDDFCLIPITKV